MTFSPSPVTLTYQSGSPSTFTLVVTPSNISEFNNAQTVYAYVIDSNKVLTNVSVAPNGKAASFIATLTTSGTLPAGTYSGNFQLELCSDAQCANQFPGSPWSEPYSIVVAAAGPQPSGYISTVAGNGTYGDTGDGGAAVSAEIEFPNGVAFDAAGNYYIADDSGSIRKVSTSGVITTVAGVGTNADFGDNGPATSAGISANGGIVVDAAGNLYFSDTYGHVRKVDTKGIITTIAGGGNGGAYSGDGSVAATTTVGIIQGLAIDASGNLYLAGGTGATIRKIDTKGIITTIAGTGKLGYSGDGGPATAAQLNTPYWLAFDSAGNLYVADSGANVVRKISTSGIITTVAGTGTYGHSGDGGAATSANLSSPEGVAVDASGNIYIADTGNGVIRKVDTTGKISNFAGTGANGYTGDNGPATSATFAIPKGIALDAKGDLFIADAINQVIREIWH